ncbi:MAG: hypothetical protein ACTSV7_00810 [Candidatus Baldrarchaeia archaeon]
MEEKCSCGLAVANVFPAFERIEAELKKERPNRWKVHDILDDLRISFVPSMKKECGLDLSEEEKKLDEVKKKLLDLPIYPKEEDWGEIREIVRNTDFWIHRKLLNCAERE